MKWAPTYVNLYTVSEDPTTVSDQETTAPATETSESENKKAAGWNGCAQIKIPQSRLYFKEFESLEQCSNPCWLMMIGDDATQCIGDCGIHQPVQSGILMFASASNI